MKSDGSVNAPFDVAIIGAGFAGIGMAIGLLKGGEESFVVFERASSLGGTWRDNTYPSCGCDVPSHLYSYSFEPRPGWTRAYASGPEILAYLEYCATKYGVSPHIRFSCGVNEAAFENELACWRLQTDHGDIYARHLVGATGPLAVPSYPKIPGRESFRGPAFHSARWDHSEDLSGKRVGVIGTGASAIQFVPEVAKVAGQLHIFQRTPPWITPRNDRAYTVAEQKRFRRFPRLQRAYRNALYWRLEASTLALIWNHKLLKYARKQSVAFIESVIDDPGLVQKVTPNYELGCKRVLRSDDYYPALIKPHVHLEDSPIVAIEANGVRTREGFHELDTIIYATGFSVTEFMSGLDVRGPAGETLKEHWHSRIEAYFGLCVSGFPNLYMLVGPNTGLGHNSILFMIEAQVHWICEALSFARRRHMTRIEVRREAERSFNEGIRTRLANSVWSSGCQSWYMDDRGHNFSIWPSYTFEYWLRTRRFRPEHFQP